MQCTPMPQLLSGHWNTLRCVGFTVLSMPMTILSFLEDLKDLISTEIQSFKQSYEKNGQFLCRNMNLADLFFKHPLEVKLDHQNIFELIWAFWGCNFVHLLAFFSPFWFWIGICKVPLGASRGGTGSKLRFQNIRRGHPVDQIALDKYNLIQVAFKSSGDRWLYDVIVLNRQKHSAEQFMNVVISFHKFWCEVVNLFRTTFCWRRWAVKFARCFSCMLFALQCTGMKVFYLNKF